MGRLRGTRVPGGLWTLAAELLLLGAALVLARRVDINKFSLHTMYTNRLTRCYLGASDSDRAPQPFTGFDPSDDMPLKDLGDQRPFHSINTAMNVVQGKELAWQLRKAASFVLTPASCGFDLSEQQGDSGVRGAAAWRAFRPSDQYASNDPGRENQGFSLGMAMATSGAAASPNMGFQSTPALAVLMTFFTHVRATGRIAGHDRLYQAHDVRSARGVGRPAELSGRAPGATLIVTEKSNGIPS